MHLPRVPQDGLYDAETMRAVEEFQRQHQLPVTGRADRDTWNAIFQAHGRCKQSQERALAIAPFGSGGVRKISEESSAEIGMLQAMLCAVSQCVSNVQAVPLSMTYDQSTAQQMQSIRRLHNLPEKDELDTAAWNALVAMYHEAIKSR